MPLKPLPVVIDTNVLVSGLKYDQILLKQPPEFASVVPPVTFVRKFL